MKPFLRMCVLILIASGSIAAEDKRQHSKPLVVASQGSFCVVRWAKQLSDFDMGTRQETAEPTNLKEFLDFAAGAGRGWTAQEEENWQALVGRLSDAMKGLNLRLPSIDLVKTSGEEEFGGAAYTRRNSIMLSGSWTTSLPMTDPRRAFFLLAHELFHVLYENGSSSAG
jgi:hypothetical protein